MITLARKKFNHIFFSLPIFFSVSVNTTNSSTNEINQIDRVECNQMCECRSNNFKKNYLFALFQRKRKTLSIGKNYFFFVTASRQHQEQTTTRKKKERNKLKKTFFFLSTATDRPRVCLVFSSVEVAHLPRSQ